MEWHQDMLFWDPTFGAPLLETWPNLWQRFLEEFNSGPVQQKDPNRILEVGQVYPTMADVQARDHTQVLA